MTQAVEHFHERKGGNSINSQIVGGPGYTIYDITLGQIYHNFQLITHSSTELSGLLTIILYPKKEVLSRKEPEWLEKKKKGGRGRLGEKSGALAGGAWSS